MKRAPAQRRACIPPYFLPLKHNNYGGWWCKLTDGLIRGESGFFFWVNLHCVATVSYRYLLRVNSKKQAKQPCFLPFPKHTHQIPQLLSFKQTIHVSPCFFPLFVNPQTNSPSPVRNNGQVEPLASPLKQVRVRWQGSQINKTKTTTK